MHQIYFWFLAKKDVIPNTENEVPSVGEDEETVEIENIEGKMEFYFEW